MRVIAGQLGGRVLKAPAGNKTRPTADRVREALFSVLGTMDGYSVLDLYAGTGALGIEALSRGASRAVFVESATDAIRCLRDNLSTLDLAHCSVLVSRPVERARDELSKMAPYDLIFCDPPWRIVQPVWRWLGTVDLACWLSPAGRLVLEHPASQSALGLNITSVKPIQTRTWGDSAVTILSRTSMLEQR